MSGVPAVANPFSRAAAVGENSCVDLFLCKIDLKNLRAISINSQKNKADVSCGFGAKATQKETQRPFCYRHCVANPQTDSLERTTTRPINKWVSVSLTCDNLSQINQSNPSNTIVKWGEPRWKNTCSRYFTCLSAGKCTWISKVSECFHVDENLNIYEFIITLNNLIRSAVTVTFRTSDKGKSKKSFNFT